MKHTLSLFVAALSALILATSCDKPFLPVNSHSLYTGEDYTIHVNSKGTVRFSTPDIYNIELKESSGYFKVRYVGQAAVLVEDDSNSEVFYVTITPRYTFYKEPDVDFELSQAQVKSKFGEPQSTGTNAKTGNPVFSYSKYGGIVETMQVEFKDGKATYYMICIEKDRISDENLRNFLNERYNRVALSSGQYIWGNALDKESITIGVVFGEYTINNKAYEIVTYMPYDQFDDNAENAILNRIMGLSF